jgi:tRNA modification GTPase
MLVEATLDFPEEEIDFLQKADAPASSARLQQTLAQVMQRARQGALLREGIKVVIAGQPNAGKSSLLNALAGAELAIVTPIAGTTRDVVQPDHPDRGRATACDRHRRPARQRRRGREDRH